MPFLSDFDAISHLFLDSSLGFRSFKKDFGIFYSEGNLDRTYLEPKYEADPVDSSAISPIDFAAPGLLLDLLISDEVEVVVV